MGKKSDLKTVHRVEDGAGGILHTAFGVGAHVSEVINTKTGEVVAKGSGVNEDAASRDLQRNIDHQTEENKRK